MNEANTHQKLVGHCGYRTLLKLLNHYVDNINKNPALEDIWRNSRINQKVLHIDFY